MEHFRNALIAALAASAIALSSPPVAANEPVVSAEDKVAARKDFEEGKAAFNKGDYRHAAESFELAYKRAPHHAPLWNAARAWEKAGESARAANLYAKYLRDAPPRAPDRNSATTSLKALSAKLARLEIHPAPGLANVRVDKQALDPEAEGVLYVTPGAHLVEAQAGDQEVHKSQPAEAGDVVSVVLDAPPALPPVTAAVSTPKAYEPSRGWSPAVVGFGGAVAVIVGGLAIWSGVDTLHQKDTFDAAPTQDNLDSGRSKQTRTNVLIAVAAGAAVLTTAAAIWLVDWRGKKDSSETAPSASAPRVRVGVGLGAIVVRGDF